MATARKNLFRTLLSEEFIQHRGNKFDLSNVIKNRYELLVDPLHSKVWTCNSFENDTDVNEFMKKQKFMRYIRRGDVVKIPEVEKNFIYDGSDFQDLETASEYNGIVPSTFHINDFPIVDYFATSMEAGSYVWLYPTTTKPTRSQFDTDDNASSCKIFNTSDGFKICTDIPDFENVYMSNIMLCECDYDESHKPTGILQAFDENVHSFIHI